jgi:hypothetical protein
MELPLHTELVGSPYSVTGISLCPFFVGHFDDESALIKSLESTSTNIKSILVNIAGNLLLFQPDLESLLTVPKDLLKKPVKMKKKKWK